MAELDRKNPLALISAVLVALAALGIIVYTNIPLKGLRPSVSQFYEPPPKIRARLWQDPLLAVVEHYKAIGRTTSPSHGFCVLTDGKVKKHKMDSTLKQDFKECAERRGKITVLGVMVSGGPYAEDSEWRIRTRYAVLSGLDRANFIPQDPEHLGLIALKEKSSTSDDQISLVNILPYEPLAKFKRIAGQSGSFGVLMRCTQDFSSTLCQKG